MDVRSGNLSDTPGIISCIRRSVNVNIRGERLPGNELLQTSLLFDWRLKPVSCFADESLLTPNTQLPKLPGMKTEEATRASKFLSLVLRHQPETARISLDSAGWADVGALLQGCAAVGHALTRGELEHIVSTNGKKRFELSADRGRIRASQGHSVEVDLNYEPQIPPELLFHGTAARFLDAIRADGLRRMGRHHVHLSAETAVAIQVGARHGKPVQLTVRAGQMHQAGWKFFLSTNGVWLVNAVPVEFIQFPNPPLAV